MADTPPDPSPSIGTVSANPLQPAIEAGIRQLILAVSAVATALGYAHFAGKANALLEAAGPLAGGIVVIWGLVKTYIEAAKAAKMAHALPNDVAAVRPGWIGGK